MHSHFARLLTTSLAAAVIIGGTLVQSPPAGAQVVMKLAHVVNPGSPRDRLMHLFGQNLDKRTGGRIKVQVYPSAQLGDNRQIIEGIQAGTIEGTISPTAFMGGFAPMLTVMDLPLLFSSLEQVSRVANGEVGEQLMKVVEAKGLRGLAFYAEGEKNFATNFPVRTLQDLKGKRMRAIPTPVLLEQFRAWSANPVPVELSETYSALQNGTVDGQEQQWGLIHDLKYYEVSKYLTQSQHGMLVEFFFVSKRWFDRLPKDLQDAVVAEAKALIPVRLEWARSYTAESLKKLKSYKDIQYSVLPAPELEALRKASQPVYAAFVKANGSQAAQLIDRIKREVSAGK